MSRILIPGRNPLARAMRGWSGVPNKKPQIRLKSQWKESTYLFREQQTNAEQGGPVGFFTGANAPIWGPEYWRTPGSGASPGGLLEIPDLGNKIEDAFTVVLRIRPRSHINYASFITSKTAWNGNGFHIQHTNALGGVQFRSDGGTAGVQLNSTFVDDEWITIVGRYNGTVFINLDVMSPSLGKSSGITGGRSFTVASPSIRLSGNADEEYSTDSEYAAFRFIERYLSDAETDKVLNDYLYGLSPANETPFVIAETEAAPVTGQYAIPADHPLTRSLRGWPSSPLVMPQSSLIEVHNRPAGFTAVHVPGSDAYDPNNIKTIATVRGAAWTNESTGNRQLKAARIPFRLFESCTIFAYVIPASIGTSDNVHFLVGGIRANTAGGWRILTDRVAFRTAIGAQNTDLTGFTEVGKPSVIVLKSLGGDGHWVYVDGTLLDYNTNNPQYNPTPGGEANIIGDNTTAFRGVDHQIIGVAYANRALSDAEIVYYSKNPREIGLASNQTPFMVSVPGVAPGPVPVLSNIEATGITQTSVTPQVDITFP